MKKFIALLLCCTSYSNAALTFGAVNSDHVNISSAASIDNLTTFTWIEWVYPTTLTNALKLVQKGHNATGGFSLFQLNGTGGNIEMQVRRATTSSDYITSSTPLATTNAWAFVAGTSNTGTTPVHHIYKGTATAKAVEATYGTTTDGSGAQSAEGASEPLDVANTAVINANAFKGGIALFAEWNRVLSLGEIQAQQFAPHVTSGCVVFIWLGANGTGTQGDWSGHLNNGTVTGATVSNNSPIAPFSAFLHQLFPMLPAWWMP